MYYQNNKSFTYIYLLDLEGNAIREHFVGQVKYSRIAF